MNPALLIYLAGLLPALLIAGLFVAREGARRGDHLMAAVIVITWPVWATVIALCILMDLAADALRRGRR